VFVVDEGPADEIDQMVTTFRRAIARKADEAEVKALARELEKRLLEPLYPLSTDKTSLILSPDGQLSLLPFAALWDGEKYAAQRWTLSYVTSGRDLVRPPSKVASRQADVVVADPAFGSVGEGKSAPPVGIFSDLPGALREGQAVHGVLPSSTLLMGSEATEETIKNLHGPRILHLATHGFFLTTDGVSATGQSRGVNLAPRDSQANYRYVDDPMLKSGIALARANTGGSSQENGILTAMEVSDMDLGGTDLVVLSACDTGVGEAVVGDGVYGLRRAFAIAGARTQVLSLWQVDDEATGMLMNAFYRDLISGTPKQVSLQRAQLSLLNGAYSHPYYWAAFALSGERGPLQAASFKSATPESPRPVVPDQTELPQVRERLAMLNARAAVVRDLFQRLERSQQTMGLRPNARFTEPEALMGTYLEAARTAVNAGDLAGAKENSAKAEQQITLLEKLFNR
jgi:CHAT domain-containing protein